MLSVDLVTVVVRDYDEAISFYVDVLGFRLLEDTRVDETKRWVVVAPLGRSGTRLLLARAATAHQVSRVGDQTGGRVAFFLTTDDVDRDYEKLAAAGVRFEESPRTEAYGRVAVFEDLYGNRWDLIGPASSGS